MNKPHKTITFLAVSSYPNTISLSDHSPVCLLCLLPVTYWNHALSTFPRTPRQLKAARASSPLRSRGRTPRRRRRFLEMAAPSCVCVCVQFGVKTSMVWCSCCKIIPQELFPLKWKFYASGVYKSLVSLVWTKC